MRWNILLAERNSDIDNLKRVANYILLLRFINNYIFNRKRYSDENADKYDGFGYNWVFVGMPQTIKQYRYL